MENHNEIRAIIERAKDQLTEFYDGDSWVTNGLSTRIFPLTAEQALQKVQGHNHSIAQLLEHIIAWRNFGVEKLTGNASYDIRDESSDWPVADNWDAIREEFIAGHEKLLGAVEAFPLESWTSGVPGRDYTFLYLVHGIIQHDYYHYGQMGALLAALKK